MRVTRRHRRARCAICERTLLMGERAIRFAPDGGDGLRRRLPALPRDRARARLAQGGQPDDADASRAPRRRRRARALARLRAAPRRPRPSRSSPEPILRRLSEPGARRSSRRPSSSTRARTGARSAGSRRASASRRRSDRAALGRQQRGRRHGRLGHLVVPVPRHAGAAQPVRLEERGHELEELDGTFRDWNAHARATTAASCPRSRGV